MAKMTDITANINNKFSKKSKELSNYLNLMNMKYKDAIKYLNKKYGNVVDDFKHDLVSFAISRRLNVKRGKYLGKDPQGKLGKIYVGQTFSNRVALYLSWKYLQEDKGVATLDADENSEKIEN